MEPEPLGLLLVQVLLLGVVEAAMRHPGMSLLAVILDTVAVEAVVGRPLPGIPLEGTQFTGVVAVVVVLIPERHPPEGHLYSVVLVGRERQNPMRQLPERNQVEEEGAPRRLTLVRAVTERPSLLVSRRMV